MYDLKKNTRSCACSYADPWHAAHGGFAAVSGEGWYINQDDILVVTGKLTGLPQYSYQSINIISGGELALAESEVWTKEVINTGTVTDGTFHGEVENTGVGQIGCAHNATAALDVGTGYTYTGAVSIP